MREAVYVRGSQKDLTGGADGVSGEEPPRRDRFLALLRPFGSVRRDEAVTAGALALTVFLLLTAYYVLMRRSAAWRWKR